MSSFKLSSDYFMTPGNVAAAKYRELAREAEEQSTMVTDKAFREAYLIRARQLRELASKMELARSDVWAQ